MLFDLSAGDFHSGRDWDNSLFHPARSADETVPRVLASSEIRIHVLPALWHVAAPHLPELRPRRGIGLGELPGLRHEAAIANPARRAVKVFALVAAVFRPPSVRNATPMAH